MSQKLLFYQPGINPIIQNIVKLKHYNIHAGLTLGVNINVSEHRI